MKNKIILFGLVAVLCAAVSAGGVLVRKHKNAEMRKNTEAAILNHANESRLPNTDKEYPLYVVTGSDFVIMRATASDAAEEVNQVFPGSIVEFMGDAADDYAYIRGKGSSVSGYVKKENLKEADFVYSLAEIPVVGTDTSLYSYDELIGDIQTLDEEYECLQSQVITQTADGRDVYKLSIGDAPKKMLIYASPNGSDYMTSQLLMKQAEYFAHYIDEGIYNGYKYSDLINSVSIDIIPMPNPDGMSINQWGSEIVADEELKQQVRDMFYSDRKYGYTNAVKTVYYNTWKANARGIDINRNFPAGFDTVPHVLAPSHAGYKGDEPLSENESVALAELIGSEEYCAVVGYTAEGACVRYISDLPEKDFMNKTKKFAETVSQVTNYPIDGDTSSYTRSGSFMRYCTEKGILSLEIGLSKNKAPLSPDDLQEPWIKLRELPMLIAQLML